MTLFSKKLLSLTLILMIFPASAWALDVSFGNPVGTQGTITGLFQAILTGILNIIAFLAILFIVIGGVMYLVASTTGNDNLISSAKKIWVGSIIGLSLALAGPTFLKEINTIVLNGGPMPTNLASAPSLSDIVASVLSFLLSIIGILAIISLVINGIIYLTLFGDSSKAQKVKANINFSLFGLLIAGSALIIVRQIAELIEN